MKNKKNNKGFSLVELIVVIAIMAVLVGVLAPQFLKYVESSRISTDMQNIQQLKTAVEVAAADETTTAATFTITITSGTTDTFAVDPAANITTTATSGNMKSSGWSTQTWTFTTATGTWDVGSTDVTTNNGKDMKTVFNK